MEQEQGQTVGQGKSYLLPASIVLAAILISGSILVRSDRNPGEGKANVRDQVGATNPAEVREGEVILGDPKAPVTIVEYGDYQCPYCARFFEQTEPLLREQYVKTGKAKMIYRDFAFLGPESYQAAEAASCAKDQKQFWGFHDLLFREEAKDGIEHNGNLSRDLFMKLAAELKLDTKVFAECFDAGKYRAHILEVSEGARNDGVRSTPTVFLNDVMREGALPFAQFKAIIEELLAQ